MSKLPWAEHMAILTGDDDFVPSVQEFCASGRLMAWALEGAGGGQDQSTLGLGTGMTLSVSPLRWCCGGWASTPSKQPHAGHIPINTHPPDPHAVFTYELSDSAQDARRWYSFRRARPAA